MPRGRLFGIDIFPTNHLYAIMLPVTGLLFLAVWAVRRSSFWPVLLASRDAPDTVAHFGSDPRRVRMAAFMLAAFIAAIGGAFWGILLTRFSPFEFSFGLSIALLLYTVIGGSESLAGPVIAAVLFGVVPQILQKRSGAEASAWPDLIAGVLVVVLVAANPRGLAAVLVRRPHPAAAGLRRRSVRFRQFGPWADARRHKHPAPAIPSTTAETVS
jgi:ABC-type branched-subunit amino acid transport system permease subunit